MRKYCRAECLWRPPPCKGNCLKCSDQVVLKVALVLAAACGIANARWAGSEMAQAGAAAISEQVRAGRELFAANCAFCHGPDARGGAEGGVDLTKSSLVRGDSGGKNLGEFLKVGRPPRMPAFPLPTQQVTDLASFLHAQILLTERTRASDPKLILVGDAKAGQQYFEAHCTNCHSLTGDLKGIGSKYEPPILQGRIAVPKGFGQSQYFGPHVDTRFPPEPPRKVTIYQPGKAPIKGDLLFISIFDVTYRDSDGVLHTVERQEDTPKIVIEDPAQPHIDMLPSLTSKNLHDLTAYLVTVR
jgi:cytochrome c oxidase cbb3-type subunit III